MMGWMWWVGPRYSGTWSSKVTKNADQMYRSDLGALSNCFRWSGGLTKDVTHRFNYLNTWFPLSSTVREGLGGTYLLKEAHHWGI